jgi:hypothetical protein
MMKRTKKGVKKWDQRRTPINIPQKAKSGEKKMGMTSWKMRNLPYGRAPGK